MISIDKTLHFSEFLYEVVNEPPTKTDSGDFIKGTLEMFLDV